MTAAPVVGLGFEGVRTVLLDALRPGLWWSPASIPIRDGSCPPGGRLLVTEGAVLHGAGGGTLVVASSAAEAEAHLRAAQEATVRALEVARRVGEA